MDELATRLALSTERVRQLQLLSQERVRAAFAAAPERFCKLVSAVRSWLGEVVPRRVADDLTQRIGVGHTHSQPGALLLWFAGPYRAVPTRSGWLATDPAGIVATTGQLVTQDGCVRAARDVRSEPALEGIRAEHHDGWLAVSGAVVVDDMVVSTSGRRAVVAERVLFATGRAMTADEIAGCG